MAVQPTPDTAAAAHLAAIIETYIEHMRAERRLYPDLWATDLATHILKNM